MKILETEQLIMFSEKDCIYLLDKISKNHCKVKTTIPIENIFQYAQIKKLLDKFRDETKIIEDEHIRTVYISITDKCNFDCYYCSIHSKDNQSNAATFLNIRDFEKHIIPLLKNINPLKVILTGGEPCLNIDIVSIIELLHKNLDAKIMLQTNGYYLENILKEVIDFVSGINISCNSYFEGTENINRLEQVVLYDKNKFTLSYVLNKESQKYLMKFIEFASKNNYKVLINFMTILGNGISYSDLLLNCKEKIMVYYDIAKYITTNYKANEIENTAAFLLNRVDYISACGAYKKKIAINSDGNVYLCQCMPDDNNRLGNIYMDSLDSILERHREVLSITQIQNMFKIDSNKKCHNCAYRYYCGGLCYAVKHYNEIYEYPCYFNQILIKFLMFYKDIIPFKNLNNFLHYIDNSC